MLRAPRPEEIAEAARRWTDVTEGSPYRSDKRLKATTEYRKALLERWGEAEDVVLWLIEADGKIAGLANLREIDRDEWQATSGVHVYEEFRARGIATEAVALRTAYAFRELDLHKLKVDTWVENAAMVHILRKQGYREVGVYRADTRRNGEWHDVWLGELLRDDWEGTL